MIDRDRVREALTGPLTSIATPFNRDGTVDHDGLRRTLDFNIEAGSKTMLLTAGDSHYIVMSDEEIAEVSKTVVDHTAGRAMVVTADRYFHTRQAVDFAKYAAEIGSDVHMVLPPDWAASCTSETLCDHYAAIAEHTPVMIVTGVFIPRGEEFGLKTRGPPWEQSIKHFKMRFCRMSIELKRFICSTFCVVLSRKLGK